MHVDDEAIKQLDATLHPYIASSTHLKDAWARAKLKATDNVVQDAMDLRSISELCLSDKSKMTIRWINKKHPVLQWNDDWYESSIVTKTKLQFLRPIVGSPGTKERVEINTTSAANCFATLEVRKNVTPFWYDDWSLLELAVATEGKIDDALAKFWQEEDAKHILEIFHY
jgi:hypothetical protein